LELPRFQPEKLQLPPGKPPFQRENDAINLKATAYYFAGGVEVGAGGVGVGELASS
jgi:hypothetical protein